MRTASPDQTHTRIRGRKLQRLRARLFLQNPLCVACSARGLVEIATELDHIKALVHGGTNDDENLQGLCKACHTAKTCTDLGYRDRAQFDDSGRVLW
jgi:5-methylcytosine-specific restriction protein A